MSFKFMGKKRGMMQLFDESGNTIVCTVIEAEPNVIAQIKTKDVDGYEAIQLGFDEIKANDSRTVERRAGKPLNGHFKKGNLAPRRHLLESRLESVSDYQVGQEISVDHFADISFVDVTAFSKGKGYQGVIKRHNFAGGPASHGSGFHRHAGSTGMRSSPGRCLPGGKKAGHMGYDRVTVQNLKVVMVDKDNHVILVKGAVPGPRNARVVISKAVKKTNQKKLKARGV
jgi:large subunit ribosomal protein L3